MTVDRSVAAMVLILVTTVIVFVHAKDVTTLEYDDFLPANETNARHRVDTDSSAADHRQGRMSLQTELPSSKAKREQALRSILAARRRQILSQRPIEARNLSRAVRPAEAGAKDPPDVLEAQETRHGMYVTASGDGKAELAIEEETSDSPARIIVEEPRKRDSPLIEFEREGGQVSEPTIPRKPSNESSSTASSLGVEGKPASGNTRSNYTISHRNSSSTPSSPTSSSTVGTKAPDTDARKRNIVSMSESLYNYFRPVESNIPVEDMTQFLYFGQKIQPETQNATGNDSTEATPTASTAPTTSRRRYSAKRYGGTSTPAPARLDEIANEAVERQIEKSKPSKLKNAFRSTENGLYYRKTRPTTDPTIAANVIATMETGRNATGDGDTVGDRSRDDNPSAHAVAARDQLRDHERGSAATHVLPAETRNATNTTQIPYRRTVSANAYDRPEESEIGFRDRPADIAALNGVEETKPKSTVRRKKTDNSSMTLSNESVTEEERIRMDADDTASTLSDAEMYGDHTEQRIRRIDIYDSGSTFDFSRKADSTLGDQARSLNPRESNNIETSTSRDKIGRSTTEPFRIVWTSPETSTLRIIVTEGSPVEGFGIDTAAVERYTVKPVDSAEERVRVGASGDVTANEPPPSSVSARTSTISGSTAMIERGTTTMTETSTPRSKVHRHREQKHRTEKDKGASEGNRDQEQQQQQQQQQQQHHRHQEQQQQHVYAYTITNVTRLLRNYTGPGLSREEQGGSEQGTGTTEITTGSAQRRQPPPPSLLLLPRAGSGIEAGRAPAELSAGTTVEAVAAGGGSSAAQILVGERQRKVVTVAAQPEERAVSRAQPQLTVNKSSSRPSGKPTEVLNSGNGGGRGPVRWNHAKPRNTDLEGSFGDRRFLRKSASAVLNQRIGAGFDEDAAGSTAVNKRRRPTTNGQTGASGSRRVKGGKLLEENRSNERPVNGSSDCGKKDDEAEVRGDGVPVNRTAVVNAAGNMTVADSVAMEQKSFLSTAAAEPVDPTTPRTASNGMKLEERANVTEPVTPVARTDAKDQLNASPSENESAPASGSKVSVGDSAVAAVAAVDNSAENGSGSSTVTVTAAVETTEPKETTPTTTPIPPPVFPVTPRIITETARPPADNETFTLNPTEPVGQAADNETASKPFNMANSESKNATAAPEAPTTPITTVQIEISTMPQDQSTSDSVTLSSTSASVDPRKRVSGERSPEVRARNLSDKSKDKDDVLPIMHLYNTSDIFNGSGPMNSFSRGTERRVELPVHPKSEVSGTTEKVNDTIAPKSGANDSNTRVPVTERKDRHEESRETSTQVPPTGPGRGPVNGGNRTRHRPVYHHAILPEYNVSVYPDELNRTFFETGLISVSHRESVNISEVISKRHDGDAIASQETVAVVSYILATLVVFPIAVGVGLILRRLILRNRKVLEESDTSSEISCRKDALNLENGDFKTSIEKAITKLPRIQHLCHEAEKPPPPSSQESRWEFPRDKLRLQTVLGQGNFGQVWKAEADDLTGHQGTTRLVAVKTVKEGASDREKEDLVRELEIMQQLGSHPNVVTLLGCCTEQEPHYLILEYVMYGKLLAYLRDHRTRQDFYNFSEDSAALTSRDLTVFGYCVARGMEYLASKKIIHRDLAARNVLVDHNKLCKIADFGMSRFANEDGEVIETRHGRNALPIRWMAPESLIYSLFTTKTDVWSFGILMWEIVTLGSTPYPDMTAREVMRNVQNGYRLERPSHCRSELFRVISRCWHADPDRRPEFQTLRRDLAQLLEDNLNGHYVDLESFASECTD